MNAEIQRVAQERGHTRLSVLHHDALAALQGNLCAICGKSETCTTPAGRPRRLSVDHCHATGKIRELLCNCCNYRVIGSVNDSNKILKAAVAYLRRHAKVANKVGPVAQLKLDFGFRAEPSEPHGEGIKLVGPTAFSWNLQDVRERDTQILQWRQQGVTHKEIAARLGCTRQRVGQIMERLAVTMTCWCGERIPQAAGRYATYCSPACNPDPDLAGRRMLTQEQYDTLVAAQNGTCAICKMAESRTVQGKTSALAVDHCHQSGIVRELLCNRCNLLLGAVADDPALLLLAASYLTKHRTVGTSRAA
jgi:Recombination endonuclease VII/Sigma-70, region 4